ncbi:MAG: hypothetical protein U0935_17280 [Pirellulales bacterium]
MNVVRAYLGVLGITYLVLAIWCAVAPAQTSAAVGFSLTGDSGRSEFLTVYGGFELGLGLIFLGPLFRPAQTPFALTACLWLHACLVACRSVSFCLYPQVTSTTVTFAVTEWVIFLSSAALSWRVATRNAAAA